MQGGTVHWLFLSESTLMLCGFASTEHLWEAPQSPFVAVRKVERNLVRLRAASDEELLYRPCSSDYKGGINLIHLTSSEFPSPRNVNTLTLSLPGAQSLEGLQETKICCFRFSAQTHRCKFTEISGVCVNFCVKYKAGFICSDFLRQSLSIWS